METLEIIGFIILGMICLLLLLHPDIMGVMLDTVFNFFKYDMTPAGHRHTWEHGTIKVPIEDKRWNRFREPVTVPHRVCTKCGQKQYRTMRPGCNGWDDNEWINYDGELKFTT